MSISESIKQKPAIVWGIFIIALIAVFGLGMLAASITERRAEIVTIYNNKKVEITGINPHNEQWGLNYPREYDTWKLTALTDFESKHMGNTFQDVLAQRPEMVVLWAGYAFSRDYSAPRGHWYTLEDMRNSLRTGTPGYEGAGDMQPATCWSCKSPDVPRMMQEAGSPAEFYKATWSSMGDEVVNPLGCADCHDPATMNLIITRPALIEAFDRQGRDITQATHQEMRSLVCAQCHVEYYFQGDGKYLTFPWDGGMSMEDMEAYYDTLQYADWTHALSKTPMLKAQHPDYELFLLGTHGQRGLSCADCHMPYISEGGVKYSDHHIMSPLANIAGTCQTCHRDSEENLRAYVYERQDKVLEVRDRVEQELAKAHIMAKIALDNGASQAQMAPIQTLLRQAGWRWDYGVASHGASFHAPVETQRILSHALDKSMLAQLELQKLLFQLGVAEFEMPDISTKAKAQAYIGLDMDTLHRQKDQWREIIVPQWLESARQQGNL